jgi:hypothetical protein
MKKNLILTLALAGIMSLASCQSEEPAPQSGDEVVVTFKAQIPQEIQSRSFADGTTAKNLTAIVYQKQEDKSYVYVTDQAATLDDNKEASVEFSFIKGHTYAVVFWAQADDAPYTLDTTNGKIGMNYTVEGTVANDEIRDAFYARQKDLTATEDTEIEVTLTRPFAQLNLGTDDLSAAKSAGYEYTDAIVTVGTYDSMDLLTGNVEGDMINVTFSQSAFPEEIFPVTGEDDTYYDYLSMNYLLVSTKQELTTVKAVLVPSAGSQFSDTKELSFDNVPICRNYRTNIFGSLLTNSATYKVKVDQDFLTPDNDYYISVDNGDDMYTAMKKGLNVKLTADVTASMLRLSQTASPVVSTVDLNGHTITVSGSNTQPINFGCDLTLKNGTIVDEKVSGSTAMFGVNKGSLTLENINLTCGGACIDAATDESVVTIKNSTINALTYGVTTNASTPHTPTIVIDKSTITAYTPLLINVEAKVTLTSNTFIGTTQGAILRAGTYDMKYNYFILDTTKCDPGDYKYYITEEWGSGNRAPLAPIVIGNHSSSFAFQKAVIITASTSNKAYLMKRDDGEEQYYSNVYIYANQTEGLGVYFPKKGTTGFTSLTTTGYGTGKGIIFASKNIWGADTEFDVNLSTLTGTDE